MVESPGDTTTGQAAAKGGLSIVAAVAAAGAAVALAFLFYGMVGFPENIPLAFGAAVLLAEVVESLVRGAFSGRRMAGAFVHGVVVAGACWLGVWLAGLLGWSG